MMQRSRRALAIGSRRCVTNDKVALIAAADLTDKKCSTMTSLWVSVRHAVCGTLSSCRVEHSEQRSSVGPKQRCSVEVLLVMSGRIVAPRIAGRSLLWRGRSSTVAPLRPRTALVVVGGGFSSGGSWPILSNNNTSPAPSLHGRFFSEQAYTPGIGVGKTSTGYVRALREMLGTSLYY
jgi:hypothetical protein